MKEVPSNLGWSIPPPPTPGPHTALWPHISCPCPRAIASHNYIKLQCPLKLCKAAAAPPGSGSAPYTHSVQALLPKTHSSAVPTASVRGPWPEHLGISCLLTGITVVHAASHCWPRALLLGGTHLSSATWDSAPSQLPAPFPHRCTQQPGTSGDGNWTGCGVEGDSAPLRTTSHSLPTESSPQTISGSS